jgi:DNA-binding LacI/PurR family transcriptional regulator
MAIKTMRDMEIEALSSNRAARITLQDVAARADVSRSTASKVLNGRTDCWASVAVRKRIEKAVADLGYRPNLSARALRSGRTHLLGFVSPGFGVQSPHSRAGGLTEAAAQQAYTVALASHPNDSASEDQAICRLVDRSVDGIAVYPVDAGGPAGHVELRALVARGFPVVTFDGASLLDFACDDVSVDYAEVGRLQARHLLQLGRRRVCMATTNPAARSNAIREAAVRDELRKAGAPPPLELSMDRPSMGEFFDAESLEAPFLDFIARHRGNFDSIVGHDGIASIAIRLLLRAGLRVPFDVAVVGAGNGMLASHGAIPITSVSTADDAAGALAFKLLMDRINGQTAEPFRRLTQPATLLVRESTGG